MTTATEERTTPGWTADASTFGARLALIRQRMGWGNVEKAARVCGLPMETWRSWERDNREPMRRTVVAKQIAGVTGCDYLWLVHGPDRGGALPIREWANVDLETAQRYLPGQRLVATIGDPERTPRPARRARPAGTVRPITANRQRPAANSQRPLTPLAI